MQHYLKIFLALLFFFAGTLVQAENKFIIVQDEKDIPLDKFIYIIVNLETGLRFLGYSKTDLEFNDDGKVIGGVRNGGHAYLLMHALGVKEFDLADFKAKLPPKGKGEFVGGGFIKSSLGITLLHRAMSNKGAGALGESIKGTMNTRLPILNGAWGALVPLEAADELYSGIAQASRLPLVIDENILESEYYKFNAAKHSDPLRYIALILNGTRWMKQIVAEINEKYFPGATVKRPVHEKIRAMDAAAACSNTKYITLLQAKLASTGR